MQGKRRCGLHLLYLAIISVSDLVMGKLFEGAAVLEGFRPVDSNITVNAHVDDFDADFEAQLSGEDPKRIEWESVGGLQDLQRRALTRLGSRGVYWKHPSKSASALYTLYHGGDVEADGNCLFTAAMRAMPEKCTAGELRRRVVRRFKEDYDGGACPRQQTDLAIRHLYAPDLEGGWGVHIVQELKLLAAKVDRTVLDESINDLVLVGVSREAAAEAVYKERCIPVNDGNSWAKYMSVMGNADDEYDIITLQYTQEGLMNVDENREGRAAAFGDDIAIESLATEFKREIFVVQAHGSDAMVEEENCLFFLPHSPRGQVFGPPVFLLMKGTGWCGAGADHYEPLIAYAAPVASQEKAAVVL